MDYHRILPNLFIGSYPESTDAIEQLRRDGVTAVLNLQTDEDMKHFELDWNSLARCYETRGIEVRRVPVRDFDAVDLRNKLPVCVSALRDLLASHRAVYLHCSAGTGRSPSVAIAYLFRCEDWNLDKAIAHVIQCRPCSPNLEAIRLAVFSR
jgi:protein-tyrosine phosphatase